MSELRSYKHARTGKVSQHSAAAAALFPELRLFDATPELPVVEPIFAPTIELVSSGGPSASKKNKREVAD